MLMYKTPCMIGQQVNLKTLLCDRAIFNSLLGRSKKPRSDNLYNALRFKITYSNNKPSII
jgi:hypothetical protein